MNRVEFLLIFLESGMGWWKELKEQLSEMNKLYNSRRHDLMGASSITKVIK